MKKTTVLLLVLINTFSYSMEEEYSFGSLAPIVIASSSIATDDESYILPKNFYIPESPTFELMDSTPKSAQDDEEIALIVPVSPELAKSRLPGKYPCGNCSKTFRWTWGVVEHQKFACKKSPRSAPRDFLCSFFGCEKAFKRKSELQRHELRPHPLKKQKGIHKMQIRKPTLAQSTSAVASHCYLTRSAAKLNQAPTQKPLSQ